MMLGSWWDILTFCSLSMAVHCPWHQDELDVSGIGEKTSVTTVAICGYARMPILVYVGAYG